MKKTNWDTEMADKCELPKLIKGICELCRDYAYCHRPIKLFEEEENENLDKQGIHRKDATI